MRRAPRHVFAAALLALAAAVSAARAATPDTRWSRARGPAPGSPVSIGGYANGCLLGGAALPAGAGHWVVMRPSRHRYFGHPNLIAFLQRFADTARRGGLPPLFVGDLAQGRGGPTLTGHASHQTGLDVDVQYVPPRDPSKGALTAREREELPALAIVDLASSKLTEHFSPDALRLIELAARDPATARIFVNAAVKRKLCEATARKREPWLGRVRPWWGHHDHFHVRLQCPEGNPGCEPQAPLPAGDGCDASLAWWFTAEAKSPQPKKDEPPPRLPEACEGLAPP